MRKTIWSFLLVLSIAIIGYFVAYPYITDIYLVKKNPGSAEPTLPVQENLADSLVEDGWIKPDEFVYQPRAITTLEAEFQAEGYPPFLYLPGDPGKIDTSSERSTHEDGMEVTLEINSTGYLEYAKMEFQASTQNFSSTAMGEQITPFYTFVRIITGKELSNADKSSLLRSFTTIFNDTDSKPRRIEMNGLQMIVSLDKFYKLIIIETARN